MRKALWRRGDRFGRDPEYTIGTGPFIFRRWNRGVDMVLEANRECWSGAPRSEGLLIKIVRDPESQRVLRLDGGDVGALTLTVSMWERVGVRATVSILEESDFMAKRKSGELACYCNTWSADFNDPDNSIYTFFGNTENTRSRSLCYSDSGVMKRVRAARAIVDEKERIREYQALEREFVQEDAAWISLFSRQHYFVVSKRVDGFRVSWNGWASNSYRGVAVETALSSLWIW